MFNNKKLLQDLERLNSNKSPNHPLSIKILVKFLLKLLGYFCLGFIIVAIILIIKTLIFGPSPESSWLNKIPLLKQVGRLTNTTDNQIKGEARGRINILLLGIGGKNHDGGLLTDTIMVASIDPINKKIALLSIPRDLSVPIEGYGWRKVNNINAYAEMQQAGSGGQAVSQTIGSLLQEPIDYYATVDFSAFSKLIDQIGSLDIYVDNTLDDYAYPILGQEDNPVYNNRYEHLHIEKGWQKMNGALALKYARSRHGVGGEGSDFARAKRQQKVIQAAKDKLLSVNTLFNPKLLSDIISNLQEHISTDLKFWEITRLWNITKEIQNDNITTKVLDNTPNGLLVDTVGENGAYLLSPRSGDFSEIQYLFKNIFGEVSPNAKIQISKENTTLQVLNGTWINGLASRKAMDLEKYGFEVVSISNCSKQNFDKSIIYDLTFGEKKDSLELLKQKTNATVAFGLPDWLKQDLIKEASKQAKPIQPDLILILGQDANKAPTISPQ